MHTRCLLLMPLLLLLAGCTPTKEVYTPDGRQGYTIDCSAQIQSWSTCFGDGSQA